MELASQLSKLSAPAATLNISVCACVHACMRVCVCVRVCVQLVQTLPETLSMLHPPKFLFVRLSNQQQQQ